MFEFRESHVWKIRKLHAPLNKSDLETSQYLYTSQDRRHYRIYYTSNKIICKIVEDCRKLIVSINFSGNPYCKRAIHSRLEKGIECGRHGTTSRNSVFTMTVGLSGRVPMLFQKVWTRCTDQATVEMLTFSSFLLTVSYSAQVFPLGKFPSGTSFRTGWGLIGTGFPTYVIRIKPNQSLYFS